MVKFIAVFSSACLLLVLAAAILYLHFRGPGARGQTLDSPAVLKEVRRLNDLVTVRYSIEKVVGMKEEKSPVGSESILLLVEGKVLAGVDLADLAPDNVTVSKGGAVRIRLAPPRIQEAYLDEKHTKVWDRGITWWTPWVSPDTDLEHKARMQALEDIRKTALDMGILGEAQRNAEMDIRNILQAFGIEQVAFAYGS